MRRTTRRRRFVISFVDHGVGQVGGLGKVTDVLPQDPETPAPRVGTETGCHGQNHRVAVGWFSTRWRVLPVNGDLDVPIDVDLTPT